MDAHRGVRYEGEAPPAADPAHLLALRAWALLGNGHGGIDWAGLPLVAGLLGVPDPEALIWRLLAIRGYRPPNTTEDTPDGTRSALD